MDEETKRRRKCSAEGADGQAAGCYGFLCSHSPEFSRRLCVCVVVSCLCFFLENPVESHSQHVSIWSLSPGG